MDFSFETLIKEEVFPPYTLLIERLKNLNETIDALFADAEKSQDTRILEDLCPYFGVVWPSARALTQKLATLPENLIRGTTVLEMGCGLALPSLLMSLRGAQVTAMDFHPSVRTFLERNLRLNGNPPLQYLEWSWASDQPAPLHRYDWIIGTDVLYEKHQPETLARFCVQHLNPQGTLWIADPARPYLQAFVDQMKAQGFKESTEVVTAEDEPKPKEVFLTRFAR